MPGIGLEMEGAVQQAPHPLRQIIGLGTRRWIRSVAGSISVPQLMLGVDPGRETLRRAKRPNRRRPRGWILISAGTVRGIAEPIAHT
jgi:hypothetical protein